MLKVNNARLSAYMDPLIQYLTKSDNGEVNDRKRVESERQGRGVIVGQYAIMVVGGRVG